MANEYALINPGKYHLGVPFDYPPLQNRRLREKYLIRDIKWKTSVLIGRRLYVGNVSIVDNDGTTKVLTDSIFKSKQNKFDSFTVDRRIDVAVGDGEEIIRLASYADRLLQFKQNTLHIINVTKSTEILEATHKFKGVSHYGAVCETDYGIAWCNAHGVYIYNGEGLSELFLKKGIRYISENKWKTFYKEGETMIGYIRKSKQLLLIKGITQSNSGNIMLYNMVTGSWTESTGRLTDEHKTNLINIWDGKLVFGYESSNNAITIVPWESDISELSVNDTNAIDNFKVQTKEIHFGNQSKKKVIKVRITYKGGSGGNTNVLPKYAINSGAFSHSFQDDNGVAITNIVGSADWTEIELFTGANANNIRSFGIQFTDSSGASENVVSDFEINDITIIHRQKSVK